MVQVTISGILFPMEVVSEDGSVLLTASELPECIVVWSRSIIYEFTWRNIKVMVNGDFEWLNTNTNFSYGVAVLIVFYGRGVL